jgi:hypothetical protein
MLEAAGIRGLFNLPRCRGRHPHLSTFDPADCAEQTRLLIVGASNQWFATTLAVLAIPPSGADELRIEVARNWAILGDANSRDTLAAMLKYAPQLHVLRHRDVDEVMSAVEAHRKEVESGQAVPAGDLRIPEWEVITAVQPRPPSPDFALRRPGVSPSLRPLVADVVQAERLRRGWASEHFKALVHRAGLPPVRFHDLRHGTATMLTATGQPPKVVSEVLGHSTVSFTMDVYTEVAEELADAAASAMAAFVPRKSKIGPGRASNVPAESEGDH